MTSAWADNKSQNKLLEDSMEGSHQIRRSDERGFFDHGWLKTYHTFSFARYHDPDFMRFCSLRVINEDRVSPGKGFGTHSHDNMEIITIVFSGEVAHKDSMGNETRIKKDEIQAMSAGTGITHSEYNPLTNDDAHFLQIWIIPDKKDIPPRYQQKKLPKTRNQWTLLASKSGGEGSFLVEQDVKLFIATLDTEKSLEMQLNQDRYGWIQIIEGSVDFNGEGVQSGDGLALNQGLNCRLTAKTPAKILFFDLK